MHIITAKKVLIASVGLVVGGVALVITGSTSAPSLCWGHFGCDYYSHSYSIFAYAGMILVTVGAVSFFEALLFTKARIVSQIALAVGIVLMLLVACVLFVPPLFISSQGPTLTEPIPQIPQIPQGQY